MDCKIQSVRDKNYNESNLYKQINTILKNDDKSLKVHAFLNSVLFDNWYGGFIENEVPYTMVNGKMIFTNVHGSIKTLDNILDYINNDFYISKDSFNNNSILSNEELIYAANISNTIMIGVIPQLQNLTLTEAVKGDTVRKSIATHLINISTNRYEKTLNGQTGITEEQHKVNIKIANEILNNDIVWNKIKVSINNNLGYSINEIVEQDDDSTKSSWDDIAQLTQTPDNRISRRIKDMIGSITKLDINNYTVDANGRISYKSDTNNPGGLPIKLTFDEVKSYLIERLHDSQSINDMMSKLHYIAKNIDPSYTMLYNKLNTNEELKNLMFTNVKNQALPKTAFVIKNNKVDIVDLSSSARIDRQLGNDWIANISSRISLGIIQSNKKSITKIYNAINVEKDFDKQLKHTLAFFNQFGINIDFTLLKNYISNYDHTNPKIANKKFTGSLSNNPDGQVYIVELRPLVELLYNGYVLKDKEFDDKRIVNILAKSLSHLYKSDTMSYQNVEGNTESAFNKSSYISELFDILNNKRGNKLEYLTMLSNIPSMYYSNWLLAHPNGRNLLNETDGVYSEGSGKIEVHEFAGLNTNGTPITYIDFNPNEWKRIKLLGYIHGGMFFIPSPSDRGRIQMVKSPTVNGGLLDNMWLDYNGSLFKGMYNVFMQEVERIQQAMDIFNDDFVTTKVPIEQLYENYHYKYINGKREFFDKDGRLLGDAFKLYRFNIENEYGRIDLNDILLSEGLDPRSINGSFADNVVNNPKLMQAVRRFAKYMYTQDYMDNIDNYTYVSKHLAQVNADQKTARSERSAKELLVEYSINNFIFNAEYQNFIQGDVSMFGSDDKTNKRGMAVGANGLINSAFGTDQKYKAVTIADTKIVLSEHLRNIKKTLKALKISKTVSKSIIDAYSQKVDSADGQSYITLAEFEKRLFLFGILDDYKQLIDNLKQGIINNENMSKLINLQKNFYFALEYDPIINMMKPNMIKNSEFVLIPELIKGTELELLSNYMVNNKIGQLNFASAVKAGATRIARITDTKGNLIKNFEKELTPSIVEYKYEFLRKQQDIVDHIVDTKNKMGAKTYRKLKDNVKDRALVYTMDRLMAAKVIINSEKVDKEILTDGKVDLNKISKLLEESILKDGNSNELAAVQLDPDTKLFTVPLDFSLHRSKHISYLLSLYNNKVNKLTMPGIHGPQVSNAFMSAIKSNSKDGKGYTTENPTLRPLKYSRFENGNSEFIEAEVLLPAWTKLLLSGKEDITLEQLDALGLSTMMGYRMPTEDKHSYFVFKVVGFLDSSQGSTIVVPNEVVTQMGSDFDIDTIYTVSYSFYVDGKGQVKKYEYLDEDNIVQDIQGGVIGDNLKLRYANHILSKIGNRSTFNVKFEEVKAAANRSYAAFKANRTKKNKQLNQDIGSFTKETYDDIIAFIENINSSIKGEVFEYIGKYKGYDLKLLEKIQLIKSYAESSAKQHSEYSDYLVEQDNIKDAEREAKLASYYSLLGLYVSDSIDQIKEQYQEKDEFNKEYSEYIKSSIANKFWNDFRFNSAIEIANQTNDITLEDFSKKKIELQNTEEAIDNRLLDHFISILSDPEHFIENTSPNTTVDMELARDLILAMTNKVSSTNYTTMKSQNEYRDKNIAGKHLKAISINRDTFISMAQQLGLALNIPIKIKYSDKVKPKYKDYYNEKRPSGVIELLSYEGTENHIGKLLTSYISQTTANILDNVAKPLSANMRGAFGVFRTLIELKTDMNFASLFIHHPVVTELLKQKESDTFYSDSNGYEYAKVYNIILNKLMEHYYDPNNKYKGTVFTKAEFDKYETNVLKKLKPDGTISKSDSVYFKLERVGQLKKVLGAVTGIIDEDVLINDIETFTSKGYTKENLISSLNILQQYQMLENISEETNTIIKRFSQDRKGLVKTFRNHTNPFQTKFSFINAHAESIYTDDVFVSRDPVLAASFKYGNQRSYNKLKGLFLENNKHVKKFIDEYFSTDTKIMDDIIAYNLRHNSILSDTDLRVLLNLENTFEYVDVTDMNNLQEFEQLPVINKLILMQNQYKEVIDVNHLLFKMIPINGQNFVDKTGYANILFNPDTNIEKYIDEFNEMYYNTTNPYFHLLAKDLVKFSYFNNGLIFGKNLSKIIPSHILSNTSRVIHNSYGIDIINGFDLSTTYYMAKNEHYEPDFQSPYTLKYAIDYSRRNHRNNKLVPIIKNALVDTFDGTQIRKKGTPNWNTLANYPGLIAVTQEELNTQSREIRNAVVVKKFIGNDYKLYARVRVGFIQKNAEEVVKLGMEPVETTMYFYVPVSKLNKFEYTDESVFKDNNDTLPFEHYLNVIDQYISNINMDVLFNSAGEDFKDLANESIAENDIDRSIRKVELDGHKYYIENPNINNPDIKIYNQDGIRIFTAKDSNGAPIIKDAKELVARHVYSEMFNKSILSSKISSNFINIGTGVFAVNSKFEYFSLKDITNEKRISILENMYKELGVTIPSEMNVNDELSIENELNNLSNNIKCN
jgi:hypothetical protein